MSEEETGESSRRDRERRKHHPLVQILRAIRKQHTLNQLEIEMCMKLTQDKLKHIEDGRDYLPGLQSGASEDIGRWLQKWMECVHVSIKEREEIEETLMNV